MKELEKTPVNVYVISSIPLFHEAAKSVLENCDCSRIKVEEASLLFERLERGEITPQSVVVKVLVERDFSDLVYIRGYSASIPILVVNVKPEVWPDGDEIKGLNVQGLLPHNTTVEEFKHSVLNLVCGTADICCLQERNIGFVGAMRPGSHRMNGGLNNDFTRRQREIMHLMAEGATNPQIAAALYISTNTVKTHVREILRKLGASNRTQAALLAADILGIISEDGFVHDLRKVS
jgi:DNA-binding NarL/FixJ family response regulator